MQYTLRTIGAFAGLTLMVAACDSSASKETDQTQADSTYAPVETKAANSTYKPAFEGQTRIAGVKTNSPYNVKVLSEGLNRPWGIAVLPDGRLLITEKEGTLRIATADGGLSDAITGIPAVNADGQGGLLGITIDPAFESNRMIYWVFSQDTPNGTLTAVAKGSLAADEKTVENAQVIYQATPAHKSNLHYGGRILFDKNGNLFVSTGERSDIVTRPQAQELNSALGKVLRITTDGKPAAGNPFEGNSDARPEIYSYGHRNVQGLAIHPVTGDLWETEFGPRGGDEVNLIQPGKNYGWPTITYGIEYNGNQVGDAIQQQEGMEQPVYYYDPVLSPSGITFFKGNSIPEWENNLFISGLSSVHIARLVIVDNKVVGEERLLEDQAQRFRDVKQGNDGALYAVTDGGRLYRIGK
ncbi:PQQ-dependent sugar dehydrogenase [Parapedobacter koreensis]|uniref:Glucose/arabinose dehydrogenase, beta-propeller fold n=1 Tax=Parapedobacter koreensis TaxID=332977 RepID=A0A1H7SM94_9SPHI|nr:PQQ-dependent sugar dehydrogenase [Parapedobacter koreensis]SEL73625.1 Glucose/arabinose dehydrogenase, beta-propeller fold [Parapedobacter koreensis]